MIEAAQETLNEVISPYIGIRTRVPKLAQISLYLLLNP
jgi:hypothetical protein